MKTFFAAFLGVLAAAVLLVVVGSWWASEQQREEQDRKLETIREEITAACSGLAAVGDQKDSTHQVIQQAIETYSDLAIKRYGSPAGYLKGEGFENQLRAAGCLGPMNGYYVEKILKAKKRTVAARKKAKPAN
ncbi:MAG: hypothetical protein ABSB82_16475 [Terriglobia bacterium]|jgi:hypothetical protein